MKSLSLPILILLFLTFIVANAYFFRTSHSNRQSSSTKYTTTHFQFTQVQKWFDGQLIDHFNKQDARTYSQRYWVVSDYYKPGAPIFLYICGEYTCTGVPEDRLFPLQEAQKHNALFVVLEHRYYGLSQPFKDLKTANLAYLTVEQALEDIAYFMAWFKVNSGYSISPTQPWLSIGGSYPGAMAAWFRYKYPHLTIGAWASSAVVEAILDFSDFDYQIYLSAKKSGPACPRAVQDLTKYFEEQLFNTTPDIQKAFQARFGSNAMKLSREELLWYISDVFVETIQYGERIKFCMNLTTVSDFETLVDHTIDYINSVGEPRAYSSYFLKNETFDPLTMDLGRQWNYQVCTQFGWLQTPAKDLQYAMRSTKINLDFYKKFCQETFGIPLWPNVDRVNTRFGGLNLKASNLIMTNGGEDPWQWASLLTNKGDIVSIYIDCDDCAHCVELYTPTPSDPPKLQSARTTVSNFVAGLFKH